MSQDHLEMKAKEEIVDSQAIKVPKVPQVSQARKELMSVYTIFFYILLCYLFVNMDKIYSIIRAQPEKMVYQGLKEGPETEGCPDQLEVPVFQETLDPKASSDLLVL